MANCIECGTVMMKMFQKSIKDGPICNECASKLRINTIDNKRLKCWSIEDLGEYQYYMQEMDKLKAKFNFDNKIYNTKNGNGIEYDSVNHLIHVIEPDLYFDCYKMVLCELIPDDYYGFNMSDGEYEGHQYNEYTDAKYYFHLGFLDQFYPCVKVKLDTTAYYYCHDVKDQFYPFRPKIDNDLTKELDTILNATMDRNGIDRIYRDYKITKGEREIARAQFIQEKFAMLCYMHRIGNIGDMRFHELAWNYTHNDEVMGWFIAKFKDYSPYNRPDLMKQFGIRYSGESKIRINVDEEGTVLSDEEIIENALAIPIEFKGEHTKYPENQNGINAMKLSNYLKAASFYPTDTFNKIYQVDAVTNNFILSEQKNSYSDMKKPFQEEVYRFSEIMTYKYKMDSWDRSVDMNNNYIYYGVYSMLIAVSDRHRVTGRIVKLYDGKLDKRTSFLQSMINECSVTSDEVEKIVADFEKRLKRVNNTKEKDKEDYLTRKTSLFNSKAIENNSISTAIASSFISFRRHGHDIGVMETDNQTKYNLFDMSIDIASIPDYAAIDSYRQEFALAHKERIQNQTTTFQAASEIAGNTFNKFKGLFGKANNASATPIKENVAVAETQTVRDHKFCTKCGNKIEVESKFCSKCGAEQ